MKEFTCRWKIIRKEKVPFGERRGVKKKLQKEKRPLRRRQGGSGLRSAMEAVTQSTQAQLGAVTDT